MAGDNQEDIEFDDGATPQVPARFVIIMRSPDEAIKLEVQLAKRGYTGLMARTTDDAMGYVTSHNPTAFIYCRSMASDSSIIDSVRALHPQLKVVQLHGRLIMSIAGTLGDTPELLAALVQSGIRLSPRFMPHGVLPGQAPKAA